MKYSVIIFIFALCSVWSRPLFAGTTGKIAGEVKDRKTGEALIGVNVLVEGTTAGASTNLEGYYFILNLPPGKYTLTSSSLGYGKQTITDVIVSIDLTTTINFALSSEVIEVGEEVIVTAERPIVKKDLTSSESRVDASQIANLPVSEVGEILTLQTGITQGADGAIHIRGGRASEVAYWVDGVSVSDVYDGSQTVQLDPNSIQELQVISGTFNAEYGQAMSGVVNYVTKDGDQQFRGSISAYGGYYATARGWSYTAGERTIPIAGQPSAPGFGLIDTTELYYGLDEFEPFANKNIEGSLSGPIVEGLTFYVSGRYFKSDGWLNGYRLFEPNGAIDPNSVTVTSVDTVAGTANILFQDNIAHMNNRERLSGQAKLTYQVSGTAKFSLSGNLSSIDYRDYSHDYRLNPDGDVNKFDRAYNINALWNHTLGSSAFYTISLSMVKKRFNEYLYEDPTDSRYVYIDPTFAARGSREFHVIGTNNHQFKRNTESRVLKADYTGQVSRLHQIKAGIEGRLHRLYLEDYNLSFPQENGFLPTIPDRLGPLYEEYTQKPVELSAYIQDKLEYEKMVVNVGVRYDYFNSKGKILADPADPNVYLPRKVANTSLTLGQRLAQWYKKADVSHVISPRLGISYPITDRGILHFSYGHFLQIPSFIHLYQKPGYKVTTASGTQGVYGNPNLRPQKTVMYEFGLQQQLTNDVSFDLTAFYRDTRDWVTTSAPIPVGDNPETAVSAYVIYENRTYSNSRGVTLSVSKRAFDDLFTVNLAYTFQNAEGIASTPDQEFSAVQSNAEPPRSLVPLDWDQTHTVNLTLGVGKQDWGIFLLGRYGSGLPYTPTLNQAESQGSDISRTVKQNSRRRPDNYTVDARVFKNFQFGPLEVSAFLKVFNLFDTRNEVTVYGETGRATATPRNLGAQNATPVNGINTVEEYLIRPDYYSEPREIQLGLEIGF